VERLRANDADGTERALEDHLSRADSKFSSTNQT